MEHIAAVENYLTLEALFILKYVLVLNEYYNHTISLRNSSKLEYWFSAILCPSRNGS